MVDIAIAGVGAVGSMFANSIAHLHNVTLFFLDDDVVERENIGMSAFTPMKIGMNKAEAMAWILQETYNIRFNAIPGTVELKEMLESLQVDLLIDAFDNVDSRRLTRGLSIPTVHLGVSEERIGEVVWDEHYSLPDNAPARGEEGICTRAAGRPIIRGVAAFGVRIVEQFIDNGTRRTIIVKEDMRIIE